MAGLRDLKRRIRSIGSTRKITRALQLVSAAKMRKAQAAVLASRAYSVLAWGIIGNLSEKVAFEIPLLKRHPEAKKIGVLLLGTNRGMVGSLNSNLALKIVEIGEPEVVMEMAVFGRQAKSLALRAEKNITADFLKPEKHPSAADVHPIVKYIVDLYETGKYRKIVVVYNHFVSTLVQKPTVKQLLPFSPVNSPVAAGSRPAEDSDVLLEPDPLTVLNHLIPRIIESQIYQTILESEASEHSARMVMMKNATEAAGDLISDLTLAYNQLRQNKITTELSEITAGRIALE